jgi:hypothetical protein
MSCDTPQKTSELPEERSQFQQISRVTLVSKYCHYNGYEVLRVSGLDRVEWCPVGFAGVEEEEDSMMSEVPEAEGDALDALGEVVDALGRTARDV